MNFIDRKIREPVKCSKCGKILIYKFKDGTLEFVFGRSKENDPQAGAPVKMEIKGKVKMKCFRKKCNTWNYINGF